ncbi:GNAT family N-acetyltransferase [Pontibacter sp. H259]|uniref:GNAT family N-acetyltransferase n=1 Tax=Pontibacter sp. H259 TaxID=3133421 RepID=UPI0030C43FC7
MKDTYTISFLDAQQMPQVHEAFLKAFADYYVPIQLTKEQFNTKLKRESIAPGFCTGAYKGPELAGFILTGLGEFNGIPTAYNAGTGVLPAHRGNQLTRKMYAHLLPKLREAGITQCLLEVIQENTTALKAYKAIGLEVTRALDCFRATKDELLLGGEDPEDITIQPAAKPDWEVYRHFGDTTPTWQNTVAAIRLSPDEKIILEARDQSQEVVGYIVFFPNTGAIAQLAVMPAHRNKGVGKALLREASRLTNAKALLMVNVDAEALDLKSFLKRRHFNRFLGQYEMLMPL